jgi:TonB-linked SusC/RagA family outer membrane protein
MRRGSIVLAAVFSCVFAAVASAQRAVTGRVLEEGTGQPVAGAQISVLGTLTGALADDSGKFSVTVATGPVTISVRRIGYKRKDVPLPANVDTITVMLTRDVLNLEQVVVTGQATGVERRNLASAVSVVNGTDLNRVQSQTVESALQGKVAGANISANSGAPGGGLQIQLRGTTSIIGNSEPLYVIDGIPASNAAVPGGTNAITGASSGISSDEDNAANRLADLNPNDIQTIEILKGAAASAIYGSQASNGVVLITTKRGTPGKTRFDVSQQIGYSEVSNLLGMRRFSNVDDAVAAFGPGAASIFQQGAFYDHEEELAGHKPLNAQTSLSLSGGTDNTHYFLSGLYEHDGGVVTNTGYDKQSLRFNLDQQLGQKLKVTLSSSVAHTRTRRGITGNDNNGVGYWEALSLEPTFLNLQQSSDGTFPVDPFGRSNSNATAAMLKDQTGVYHVLGSVDVSWQVLTGEVNNLVVRAIGGMDNFSQNDEVFSPSVLQQEQESATPGTSVQANTGALTMNINPSVVWTLTPAGRAFSFTTSVGGNRESVQLNTVRVRARNLIGDQQNIDRGTVLDADQNRQRTENFSLFGQEEFKLNDLYLSAGVTTDRSSANSDAGKYFVYPKVSGSYRFNIGNPLLDALKLRASIGEAGNLPLYGQKFTELIGSNVLGIPAQNLGTVTASADLHPEREREIEGGLDLYLFHNRATIGLTGYDKHITDLLQQRQLPNSSGYTTAIFNGGTMQTRGFEAEMTAAPVVSTDLQWTTGATFSLSRSKILSLPVPPYFSGGFGGLGQPRIQVGVSPTALFGPDTLADGSQTIRQIGELNPTFIMGFSNEIQYKKAHLAFLFDWHHGGDIVDLNHWLWDLAQNSPDFADPITVGGVQTTVGQYRLDSYQKTKRVYIESGSYVKLREVTLSYDLSPALLHRIWSDVDNASLSISGRNLITWTKYQGLDPEVSNFGNQDLARGIDVGPYPPSRTFWFALNLGF